MTSAEGVLNPRRLDRWTRANAGEGEVSAINGCKSQKVRAINPLWMGRETRALRLYAWK
jgi:hypothetical protein